MATLNPFLSSNAFTMTSMTAAINKMPYVPGRVGRLGIFRQRGIATLTAMIEEKNGQLSLLMTQPRGGPAPQNTPSKRTARSLTIPHVPIEDFIKADEIQDVREFGTENQPQAIESVRNDRLSTMANKLDATLEHLRIGSIKGIILDGDGSSTIYNLFTEFGVSQHTEIDFDLDNASPAAGALRKKCHDVTRKIEDELGAATYDHIHCFCSSQFFDDLVSHSEVSAAYDRWLDGQFLRTGMARKQFEIFDITFEEYRGSVTGTGGSAVNFIADDKAHFFPVGVPDLFQEYYAPAPYLNTVNTIGLPRYAKSIVAEDDSGVRLLAQMNPLPICTRPRVLIKAKRT